MSILQKNYIQPNKRSSICIRILYGSWRLLGSGEILNILEKDIKERNMPNRFYKTARIHNYIEGSILISSISSFLVGAILLKNDVKGGKYPLWVGMITFPLNGFVYGLIWRSIYLDDAINEYNKNLAY